MRGVEIRIRALVEPTEDPEKIAKAIEEIFGELKTNTIDIGEGKAVTAESKESSLDHLRYILARDRIRDTVRRVLRYQADDNRLYFELNRHAAYGGHFSFYHENESPMGPIEVNVKGDTEGFIEFICGR
ncbi:MAG: RNA-binding domain-containing protein [Candidatus Bathyarchaeia archaeon]